MTLAPITDLLQSALALHRQGSVDAAAARYAEVLRADPANADAYYYLATIACQRGRFDEGAELARKAIAAEPRHARAHVLFGRSLHALGRRDEALASFERAIAISPDLAQAHGNRADLLGEIGRHAEAVESYDRAVALAPASIEDWFNRGVALAAMERRDDALASFDRVVAAKPSYVQAHLWRAKLLTELRRGDEALEVLDQVLASAPNFAEAWLGRGNTLTALKRYDEALAAFDRTAAIKSDLAEAWLGRGNVFSARGLYEQAFAAYDKALALNPNLVEAWLGRGNACLLAGQQDLAVEAAGRALELKDSAATRGFFVQSAKLTNFTADGDGRFRGLMLRALSEAWTLPRQLAYGCISLIKLDATVKRCVARVEASWPTRPTRLPRAAPFSASELAALAGDELLRCLLECQPVIDIDLERLLTNIRCVMLAAADDSFDESLLGFYCAVARQCFVNEYVFSVTDAEAEQVQRLRASLEKALAAGEPVPWHWPVIVGAYCPLHVLARSEALLGRTWPQPIEALLVQQIKEPAHERSIAQTIPVLTPIDDSVSRMVRQHYEDKPYPRWVKAGPPAWPPALKDRRPDAPLDVLIAGCGTGLFTIEFARQAPQARILAVDLSVASLSYAKRMAENFGLTNIEFGQADVMELGSLGRDFDFVAASGLLHHLADPWKGWRVLLSLLRPDGIMQVGLYSELARRNIVAAHELIAHRGYRPVAEDIRRCRDEIMALKNGSFLKSVTMWADFFTTNECGTLLFRFNEHRLTLPQIKSFLAANDLEFMGFILDAAVLHRFTTRFPQPEALTDLDLWQAFENQAPQTFAGLYEFSVRKAAAGVRSKPRRDGATAGADFAHAELMEARRLFDLRRYDEALAAVDKALALDPAFAEAWLGRGNILSELKRHDDAGAACDKALALQPEFAEAWLGRGNVWRDLGRYEDALSAYDKALQRKPDLAEAWLGRGNTFHETRRGDEAVAAFDKALALNPALVEAWLGRGNACHELKRGYEALAAYDKALALNPNMAEAWLGRGNALFETARPAEAAAAFDKALALKPDYADAISNQIFALEFADDAEFAEQQKARRIWWDKVGSAIAAQSQLEHANARDPDRRLKVGYVSGDFWGHSAAFCFRPLLLLHDKRQFDVTCYSCSQIEDELTRDFQRAADRWRNVARASDDELCRQIQADQIDVLVDLSGHTAGNRLRVFARKPAPVQVSAGATGTGLPTIDYLLSDPVICPQAVRHLFAEKIVDLPCIMTIERLPDRLSVTDPPVLAKGHVTFGMFNRASKISDDAVVLWARILQAVPRSQLLFKHYAFDEASMRSRLLERFAERGIAAERIGFLGATSRREHLAAFKEVDISLDPFPQNGGISTLESLQMGVPVVAKLGNSIASRSAGAILTSVGMADWVADDADGYLAIAVKFAAAPDRLKTLRHELPGRIAASAAGDNAAYTRAVEKAYRTMWAQFCRSAG